MPLGLETQVDVQPTPFRNEYVSAEQMKIVIIPPITIQNMFHSRKVTAKLPCVLKGINCFTILPNAPCKRPGLLSAIGAVGRHFRYDDVGFEVEDYCVIQTLNEYWYVGSRYVSSRNFCKSRLCE